MRETGDAGGGEIMDDLWVEFDRLEAEIDGLKKQQKKILKNIRKVPSERDLKICSEYLRDIKRAEIAVKYGLTEGRVSQIVRECMPYAAGKLRNFRR